MAKIEKRRANCHFCGYLCGFVATVEDGKVTAVEPDPSRYPYDPKILASCRRWPMNIQMLDSPRRINHPLRRLGERGSCEWEQVSWDEALDDIAARLDALRSDHGSGVLASMIGGPHTSFWPLHRFMSNFGSPNNAGIGQICWNPRIWSDAISFGWTVEPDISDETNTIVIWGTNPAESDNSAFWRSLLSIAKSGQKEIIVIDPRLTKTARIASTWLAPRPGSDAYLALAFLNVIVQEQLYDEDFASEWCYGFEELSQHASHYTPELVSDICGIAPEDIKKAARSIANSPCTMTTGRGVDQIGRNVLPFHRARCAIIAMTGSLDVPGGMLLLEKSRFTEELVLEDVRKNWDVLRSLSLNSGKTPLQSYEGYSSVEECTQRLGQSLPARYLTSVHPDLLLKAMETGDPYPVRALVIEATNPLLTYADTHRVHEALLGLDLLVVLDYYMTPTAALADYVLPAASAFERATFQAHGGVADMVYGGSAAVSPYYERRSDYDFFRDLGIRLGQTEDWPYETFEEACSVALDDVGLSWEEYCESGGYATRPLYFKHLLLGEDDEPIGFGTESGKVQLASPLLERMGSTRVPFPAENVRLVSDELRSKSESEGFSYLTLITGGRKQPYNASMYLENEDFRLKSPYPLAEVSERTAKRLGVASGDTLLLCTDQGQARFICSIIEMADDVIHADYGWWHPEWQMDSKALGGIWESNVNTLTSCSLSEGEPMIGTWSYNAMDCMVKKVDDDLSWRKANGS